jgi:hypothetical protein
VTVLDLQPDWGITQVFPSGSGDWFVELEPEREELLPLRVTLPTGCETGLDVLKVFGVMGAANFRSLELEALDQPPARSPVRMESAIRVQRSPLDELIGVVMGRKYDVVVHSPEQVD